METIDYIDLNSKLGIEDDSLSLSERLKFDEESARQYFLQHVNQNTVFFHTIEEKLKYLFEHEYYDEKIFKKYTSEFIKDMYKKAYSHNFRFKTFYGAYKYYNQYNLKTFDGKRFLERYEDRVVAVALGLAQGNADLAETLIDEIITGRFQPATPTFLNMGKKQRGEMVSCFLLQVEDDMKSIARAISNSLFLSAAGGGVALCLSNLRGLGDPIKHIKNCATGVIPVMKLLEDAFSYANQLGSRDGAGAVYLHAHHIDILRFLDTKRENADEKIRMKTLSTGVLISDITIKLAQENRDMYMFSPYDIKKEYGLDFVDVNITEMYDELCANSDVRKTKINAREFMSRIAEVQAESGYPYIMFDDNVNRAHNNEGRISMSNLCSEILQLQTHSTFDSQGHYAETGRDISCNLGSMNIAMSMESPDFGKTVESAIRALTHVSDMSNIEAAPSVKKGNDASHSIGLGQMNLHGFLAKNKILYGSEESIDFTNIYFYVVLYHALRASNLIAIEKKKTYKDFKKSKYASGEFFDKYLEKEWKPSTKKVASLFKKHSIDIPTKEDWEALKKSIMENGIYNAYLQAVPPTGSISYINNSTASIHPVAAPIETRKEGHMGRRYYPVPFLSEDTLPFYQDAYEIGPKAIIDVYAAAQEHVDQGMSLTLFFNSGSTTRDFNRAQLYAWSKGIKTLYYVRMKQESIENKKESLVKQTDDEGCVSCAL